MLKAKREAVLRFSRFPLKNPASLYFLQHLLEAPGLLERVSFVAERDFLPNTLLIAEDGSPEIGFELELGAHQREEVSIVNGRLVRELHRTCALRVQDPIQAIEALQHLRGRLYAAFAFAGEIPPWYRAVLEPNPAMPVRSDQRRRVEAALSDIVREQVDLLLLAITLRQELEEQLKNRDREGFARTAPLYNTVRQRCLWDI
ncbi:MAG: YpiB family protein [Bacillota bacterium]